MSSRALPDHKKNGNIDKQIILFRAFKEKNEDTFYRVAESMIKDELAANHHWYAHELQKALLPNTTKNTDVKSMNTLGSLSNKNTSIEHLVKIQNIDIDTTKVILDTEAQTQIDRIITEYSYKTKLSSFGLKPKSKILFWGPPGCGKTISAKLLASRLGMPLAVVRLSTLITSYLGETATNIQKVFDLARSQPMVLLLDEVDAIGKNRDDHNDVGELKRVVNSLLQAIDEFSGSDSLIIAASNHQYLLDPALWRRFDDIVHFPKPKLTQSKQYIRRYLSGVKLKGSLDKLVTASSSLSFSQIEQNLIESIKTMVLEDKKELQSSNLIKQFNRYKNHINKSQRKAS